ncbi:MAG: hypothetical protein RIG62_16435 [Cyclobacteriaceae bacterium]
MKTSKTTMTEAESWNIIQGMIAEAKQDFQDDGFYYLLWGWLVLAASVSHYLLLTLTEFAHPYVVWLLMLVGVGATVWRSVKDRKRYVKTYVGTLMQSLWLAVFVAIMITLVAGGTKTGFHIAYPVVLLLYGVGTFVSGRLFRFTPLVIGAIGIWVLATISYFVPFQIQLLLIALSTMIGYIVPGYLLKSQYRGS